MEALYAAGILSLIQGLLKVVGEAREAAARNREWTPEEEATFDAKLAEIRQSPIWQVE